MNKAAHPTPPGYRRLNAGEIVRRTDIVNSIDNETPFYKEGRGGFLWAEELLFEGRTVKRNDFVAVYRKSSVFSRVIEFIRSFLKQL